MKKNSLGDEKQVHGYFYTKVRPDIDVKYLRLQVPSLNVDVDIICWEPYQSHTDRTGNLRSSVGYIIAMDGETVSENFEKSGKGNDGDTGISKARQLAEDISLAYQGSYVLIGVAGMEYAVYVEAKGKDVATTGYIQCQEYLRKALIRVFEKI